MFTHLCSQKREGIKSWPKTGAHQKNEGRDRSHNSLVQRLDPRLNRDNRLLESLSRDLGYVTLLRARNDNNGNDCRSHWRLRRRRSGAYEEDAEDARLHDSDAHLPIPLPTVLKQAAFITVRNQPRFDRPPIRLASMFLTWKKKCSPPHTGEKMLYGTQWRSIISPRPCPDFNNFRLGRRVDEAIARRQAFDTLV